MLFSAPYDPALALLPSCKTQREAAQIHARLVTTGLLRHPAVLRRLSSSPHSPLRRLARRLLLLLSNSNSNARQWNPLIKSSSHPAAVLTFALMLSAGIPPDHFSLSLVLTACSRIPYLREGTQIHSLLLKSDIIPNIYIHNSLISFYGKCGLGELARQVFDRIPHRDVVSWNSMINGYARNRKLHSALQLFDGMDDRDKNVVTWNSIIDGYASSSGDGIDIARRLFDRMPERDLISWNLMIGGYAKSGRMGDAVELFDQMPKRDIISWAHLIAGYMEVGSVESARRLFDEIPERDVIVWNIMMTGYVNNGKFTQALHLFNEMRAERNIDPDTATIASALSAISELGRLRDGIAIHDYIRRHRFPLDGKLGVALIDMYSRCGRLEDALRVFYVSGRIVDHWNAMIGGLARHGFGKLAVELFNEIERHFLKPDDITFVTVLSACSHAGLVDEGLTCFDLMTRGYRLEPKVQHYGCMVDLLGRAGKLEEAWRLIEGMPIEPNDIVWKSLLSACNNYNNFELGQKVAKNLIECNSSSYVLVSNLYAGSRMWGDVREVRMMMRERELKKNPGCSWIEIDGVVHEFVVGDCSHPQTREIQACLEKPCTLSRYSPELVMV